MEIFDNIDTNEIFLREWMPYSLDEFFFIPASKILTIANPDMELLNNYMEIIRAYNEEDKELQEQEQKEMLH